jgi:hypothetical protein
VIVIVKDFDRIAKIDVVLAYVDRVLSSSHWKFTSCLSEIQTMKSDSAASMLNPTGARPPFGSVAEIICRAELDAAWDAFQGPSRPPATRA